MPKLLVLAGEASGDLHGGKVLQELKKLRPELQIIGTGGKHISATGADLFYKVEDLAVIGFFEVAKRYSYYKSVFDFMVNKLDEEKPDVVFLVDYPGFNLKLAEEAKKRNIPVIYYIAPQVWAWKKNRIETIKKYVDHLIVLFPFEVDFFLKEGVKAHCFGHPLLDIVKPDSTKEDWINKWDTSKKKKRISLLPGSRYNEITKHLPLLFDTADLLTEKDQDIQFLIPLAPTVNDEVLRPFLEHSKSDVKVIRDDTYNTVAFSDFALVASGTASLETAILETPEIIYYRSSIITYFIGKHLLRIKMIGLPNIVAGDLLIPENPHFNSPKEMAEMVDNLLNNEDEYNKLRKNLVDVKSKLGEIGAYKKTAEHINKLIAG